MSRRVTEELKQQIPLLTYLQSIEWEPVRRLRGGRLIGLCPLHTDNKPSFLADPNRNLFYCYGCQRGGDIIRFAELYHGIRFPQALACLREWLGLAPLLEQVADFYQMQLYRHRNAVAYLHQRGLKDCDVIAHMRIGYAPGRCLRAWLTELGYLMAALQEAGLVEARGHDAHTHRIVFPLEGNLYGRSIWGSTPHLFLPGSKGGLYGWEQARRYPEVILVEGLFDYASLWQAGLRNVTCRWAATSTNVSFNSYAMMSAPYTSRSMPTSMEAASRLRIG